MKVEGNIEYPVMTVCEAYDADIRNKTRRAEKIPWSQRRENTTWGRDKHRIHAQIPAQSKSH